MKKRSVMLGMRKTSIALEDEFFDALREIADETGLTMQQIVTSIDVVRRRQGSTNLSSSVRTFVLDHYIGRYRSRQKPLTTGNACL